MLFGEAAHPMLLRLGQGACQAIEDAAALASRLGSGLDVEAAPHY
jgi:2-polyprenyl-6-methoxyphenol hydroxylase-like FAD-dependent oxidoreductase